MKTDTGFTLIELLIVVTIIGILAAVSTTVYIGVMKKAARSEAYANLEALRLLEEQVYAESGVYFPDPLQGHANPTTGASNIQAIIPGFKPGGNPTILPDFGLSFRYEIQRDMVVQGVIPGSNNLPNIVATAAGDPPCFVARATGVPGTRVCPNAADCDVFAIDCMNSKNFGQ